MKVENAVLAILLFVAASCSNSDTPEEATLCTPDQTLNSDRGDCDVTLAASSVYSETVINEIRIIEANNIPNHAVGIFGGGQGSLNPNAIQEQDERYEITTTPVENEGFISLSKAAAGPGGGPLYSFGILKNGVEVDPVAAEPFPHKSRMDPDVNWLWNLEALNVNLGLDCNNAHVQPNGKFHYHGVPTGYLNDLNPTGESMTLIGYAADGFPIYYAYAYQIAQDSGSAVIEMTTSYHLKKGDRPGDGVSAPCGTYDGVYSRDYEYIPGLGDLDEANGRSGYTPDYPNGTYYYVITAAFPGIPRYFKGTPSEDFRIGL
ncbi:MAG: hypothetical protein ACJAY8_000661 [Sphingobacteriales bacterium]|jgi:hypothetical protein